MSVPFHRTGWYRLERDLLGTTERITEVGFPMNHAGAVALLTALQNAEETAAEALQIALPPQNEIEMFVPKRNNKTKGYVAGQPFAKHKMVALNPNSSQQFYDRMVAKYGVWPSTVKTKTGA